jgi:hypothetical protein
MKFSLPILAALLTSPLIAGTAAAAGPKQPRFIVLCDCATPAKRTRIHRAIGKAGGRTVFTYESLGGFAVEPARPRDLPRLEQKLRRIPGVTLVEADGEVSISARR